MSLIRLFTAAILLVGSLMSFAHQASAAEMVWRFQSDYPYTVNLKLYSQERGHVWPGNDRVYVLDDYDTHKISISCIYAEKICYGAWSGDTYWGAGQDDQYSCEDCCARCGYGDVPLKHLVP